MVAAKEAPPTCSLLMNQVPLLDHFCKHKPKSNVPSLCGTQIVISALVFVLFKVFPFLYVQSYKIGCFFTDSVI
jgi:hypothetical protein